MSQANSEPLFKLSDFDKYEWTEVLDQTSPKECWNYSKDFQKKVEVYELSNDTLAQEIFKFLSKVTSILMEPFELRSTSSIEAVMLTTLSDYHLGLLRQLVAAITDPEMRARVADILWICKRDPEKARPIQMAKIAVESYLKAARKLEDTENWMSCYVRLKRTAQLAPLIDGKKSVVMGCMVFEHINNLIDRYASVPNEFISGSAMKVLQQDLRKSLSSIQGDMLSYATKYASIAAQKAIFAGNLQNYHKAFYEKLAYHEIEGEWYRIAGNREAERNAKLHIAEAEVLYAQQALVGGETNSYGIAAGRIKRAIRTLKKIEDTFGQRQDTFERIQELYKQMLTYQQKSMSQIISIPIDPNQFNDAEMKQTARNVVAGKSLQDSFYSLAFAYNLIKHPDALKTEAEQDKDSYKFLYFIPAAIVDKEGKEKAISSANEDSLKNFMFRKLNFEQGWYGLNFIAPACKQICSENNVKIDDLSFIVDENPFIPEKRKILYAKGLLAGLQEDLVIAAHLLIPQLENSLRHLLKQHGFIASTLTSKMIQDEYTLNKILELPDLRELLTDDIIFNLKSLLVERMGINGRNEISHGLFDYEQFFQFQILYIWWLTLYLCLYAKLQAIDC